MALLALLISMLACSNVAKQQREVQSNISIAETEGDSYKAMTPEMQADGMTPLMYVASWGDIRKVNDFLSRGADVKARDKDGWTALHHATLGGVHADTMRALIRAGADVNAGTLNNETPLMLSASKGKVDEVEILIQSGAEVNAQDSNGKTALISVAALGHSDEEAEEITKLLLQAGADVNIRDSMGETAQQVAKANGRPRLVLLLKAAGTNH